jgi:Domain of unknown function (DUF4126)
MLEIILAVLSFSAAGSLRSALPLLIVLLYGENLWQQVPFVSAIAPPIVFGFLVSWSLVELFASKDRLGQRLLQIVQLIASPLIGGMFGVAIAKVTEQPHWLVVVLAAIGGSLALVLQLVQLGWFYRMGRLPLWAIFAQDAACVILVLLAFDAPTQGGLIALVLLWLAIRSAQAWRDWQRSTPKLTNPD